MLRRGPAAGQMDLTGLNLIVVADEYKAPRGAIDANGLAGARQAPTASTPKV